MKGKLKGVFGITLTLVLLASLTIGLAGAPAVAASSNLKFTELELPKVEAFTDAATFADSEGDFWATPGASPGPIAMTPDGDILFAAATDGTFFHVLKATDGGYSWTVTNYYDDVFDGYGDTTPIVDIVSSPEYDEDTTLAVATQNFVYISDDGGKNFTQLDNDEWAGETISDLDMTIAEDGDQALMVGTTSITGGDVYVTEGLLAWTAQLIPAAIPESNVLACAFLPTFADDGDIGLSAIVTVSYKLEDVTGEGLGDTDGSGNLSGTLANKPVEVGSVVISDGTNTFSDNGDGTLTGAPAGTGTIDYRTGDFTIAGGAATSAVSTDYTYYDYSSTSPEVATTTMILSFEDISDGGGWGDDIMNAPFANADMDPFASEWGRIAFPDDFDAFGVGNNICFAGVVQDGDLGETSIAVTPPSGSDAYRVILKEAGTSQAVDLDVRGVLTTLAPTGTAVTSIDVCGDAEEATILVGTDAINLGDAPEYFSAYLSEDSGDSWTASSKCPTGGTTASDVEFSDVMTRVLMGPDFCSNGLAYASTTGADNSAFQCTTNANESWNQISIIGYGDGTAGYTIIPVTGFSAYGYIADDTLWMITQVSSDKGALFGRLDGNHWERILSYATPGVTDTLEQLDILGDGSAIFATDLTNAEIWRSTNMGATWPKKISAKEPLVTVAPVSTTTLYTGSAGEMWWSNRSGTGWTKPDDSEIPAGAAVIGISVADDLVIVSTTAGNGFISSDGGETVEKIGSDDPFAAGPTIVTSDLGFAGNGILYAVQVGSAKVMRTEVDLSDPGDAEWVQIDAYQDSTGDLIYDDTNFACGGPALTLPTCGILYVADAAPVNTDYDPDGGYDNAGGLWRSTNPTADIDSIVPPYFERETKGLTAADELGFLSLDLAPPNLAPTLFFSNNTATNYYDQVVMFTDILNIGVTPNTPEADATGVGLLPEGEVYPEVGLIWEEMAGATSYQYQVATDANFKTRVADDYTDSLATPPLVLNPNTNYYWRIRVANEGSLIGAPLISPWSETFKFKTAIGASMARPALQAPDAGEPDVPLNPTFEWSGIEWAETYEYELAIDPTTTAGGYFSEPLVALVGTNALVSTAWKCDITLDYETRYYWHVKAIGVDTETPWSDVGTFTTIGVPPETTEPADIVIPPPQEITPAWIWAIVIIGAVLVIAVIVLIVTTRRTP